jgi:septation ring formation regulator EzrA
LTNEELLDTERSLHSLADELVKLKTAIQQYEETRNGLSSVIDSVESISTTSMAIAENSKAMLARLEQGLKQLGEDTDRLSKEQKQHTKSLSLLEERLKEHAESVKQSSLSHSKLLKVVIGLLMALFAVELVNIALLVVR